MAKLMRSSKIGIEHVLLHHSMRIEERTIKCDAVEHNIDEAVLINSP